MANDTPHTRGKHYETDLIPNHGDVFSTLLQPPAAITRAYNHAMQVHILKAFRIRQPYLLGIDMGCGCHPAPNPAGRDYRRRTKHRNRRRR